MHALEVELMYLPKPHRHVSPFAAVELTENSGHEQLAADMAPLAPPVLAYAPHEMHCL